MLTIDRLVLDCRTPHDHPSPDDVSLRLRRIAERDLPGQLSARLDGEIAPTDRRIVMIRRLRVNLHLDPSGDPVAVAQAFAAAITAAIRGSDAGEDVAEFADDTEQTARLLVDLAAGTAWSRWYHRHAFPGLVHLPGSAAIRTIALESPHRFLDAVARITLRALQSVTGAVKEDDAARMIAALSATDGGSSDGAAIEAAVRALWLELPAVRSDRLLHLLVAKRMSSASIHLVDSAINAAPSVPAPSGDAVTWTTKNGALFLLLPYIIEAGSLLDDSARRRGAAAALAGPAVLADPAVTALLALKHDATFEVDVPPENATLEWLARVDAIGPVRPAIGIARLGGKRIGVVVDTTTGHWLAIGSGVGTAAALRRITDRFGLAEGQQRPLLVRELRRLGAFAHAELGDCMTANNLIRRVANSLPGFATAASAHIWRQALDAPADVTVTASGWHVRVQRSPLAEIMHICGHGDRTTVVPWLDGLPVRVVIAP